MRSRSPTKKSAGAATLDRREGSAYTILLSADSSPRAPNALEICSWWMTV